MSARKGPFGLRLPAELMTWLRDEASRHNRSTTSEALFILQNSLSTCFEKTAVQDFLRKYPTTINTEVFGLRIPDDLKTSLRECSEQHRISLNLEIVMRLAKYFEDKKRPSAGARMALNSYQSLPVDDFVVSESEQLLLSLFRDLSAPNKKAIMTLIHNLSGKS